MVGWLIAGLLLAATAFGFGILVGRGRFRRWLSRASASTAPRSRQATSPGLLAAGETVEPGSRQHDEVADIHDALRNGQRLVVVSGPSPAGQRGLLALIAGTAAPGLRMGDVVDLSGTRSADGVDLLDDIAQSLRRRGIWSFTQFGQKMSRYRARISGRPTTAERVGSTLQRGAALGSALIPVVGPAVKDLASSELTTGLRDLAVERIQGTGEVTDVYKAFTEDWYEAAARFSEPLVLVLDGVQDRITDPALGVLVDRVLTALSDPVPLVVTARDPDVDLGPRYGERKLVWLKRLTDDSVRAQLETRTDLTGAALGKLVQAINGSPERLANVVEFQRSTSLDPTNPKDSEAFLVQARASAETGSVYHALQMLDERCHPLGFALSALRLINRPLLDELARAIGVAEDVGAGDLLRPERRPPWLTVDPQGWRIGDEKLRHAILDEFRRSHPDHLQVTHRAAAEYHRRALWSAGATRSEAIPDDIRSVPQRSSYGERRSELATAHEAEWLYHLLALDPVMAFPIAFEQAVEAFQADDVHAVLSLLAHDLELPADQRYALGLLSRAAAAAAVGNALDYVRLLQHIVVVAPKSGSARALLTCELGTALVNAQQPMAARRAMEEAYELAQERARIDDRCLRAACFARAVVGMLLMEADALKSGSACLDDALVNARRHGDARLLAEVHRIRVRGSMWPGFADGKRAAEEALAEVDASVAPGPTAAISSQLAFILTYRENPDYDQAEQLLQTCLEIYRAVGDVDARVDIFCQEAALSNLRGDSGAARQQRAQALRLARQRADAYAWLANYAGWSDEQKVRDLRTAVALAALSRISGSNNGAPVSWQDAAGTLHALVAVYMAEEGDDDARRDSINAAREAIGDDATTLQRAAEQPQEDSPSVRAARLRVEERLLDQRMSEPTLLFQLGIALQELARAREAHGASDPDEQALLRQHAVLALRAGVAATPDEPDSVLRLAGALAEAGEEEAAAALRGRLVASLRKRIDTDPSDPELSGALVDALLASGSLDDAIATFLGVEEIYASDRRLLALTKAMSNARRWTEASALVEEVLHRSERPADLINEAVRLLDGMTNEEEQQRANRLADDYPDDPRLSAIAGRGLAATARNQAAARRKMMASGTGSQQDRPEAAPVGDSTEVRSETLVAATTFLRRAAKSSPEQSNLLLDASELLLDVADVSPPDAPDVWRYLADAVAALPAETSSGQSLRAACCLARLIRTRHPNAEDAAALLAKMRDAAIAGRLPDLLRTAAPPEPPPAIAVEVGALLVDGLNPVVTPDAQRLYDDNGMIATVRDWLRESLGFVPPGVRVRPSQHYVGYEMTFLVHEAPRYHLSLGTSAATTLSADAVHDATSRPAISGKLPDGRPISWIDDDQRRMLDALGFETYDARALICHVLLDAIAQHADELLDTQILCDLVISQGQDASWTRERLPMLAAVLRRLLQDGGSIADMGTVIAELHQATEGGGGFGPAYRQVRDRLVSRLWSGLNALRPSTRVVRLESSDVEALTDGLSPVTEPALTAPPQGRRDVTSKRALAAHLELDGALVVVPDGDDRLHVAEALAAAGIRVPVLAASELGEVS